MTEMIGRFLSFEETMGRGLVTFGYYVLLFLLIVTTLYDLVVAFAGFFGPGFFGNLGKFLVMIPVRFVVSLVILRIATEFILAVLKIEEGLSGDEVDGDVLSSGLNPTRAAPTAMAAAAPQSHVAEEVEKPINDPAAPQDDDQASDEKP